MYTQVHVHSLVYTHAHTEAHICIHTSRFFPAYGDLSYFRGHKVVRVIAAEVPLTLLNGFQTRSVPRGARYSQ